MLKHKTYTVSLDKDYSYSDGELLGAACDAVGTRVADIRAYEILEYKKTRAKVVLWTDLDY